MRPVPAESPTAKGKVERAIDVWRAMIEKVNRDVQFSKDDSMGVVSSMLTWACNNRIWRSGFTPNQFVLGRSPRIPTSLTAALEDGRLNPSALDHVLHDEEARRAEQIRTSANQAFFEMDNDKSARRAGE